MIAEKFWAKVDRTGDCWIWTGSRNSAGYGRIGVAGQHWLAHRYALHLDGVDVSGQLVCHRCDNPQCVRPAHLFLGSHKDNTQDMLTKGRSRDALPLDVIRAIQLGELRGTVKQIADQIGASAAVVNRIQTGASFAGQKRRLIDEEFAEL